MKLLGMRWFNTVGIARVEDEYDGIKYLIKGVDGRDEVLDTQYVMEWGNTFPADAGDVLFGISNKGRQSL